MVRRLLPVLVVLVAVMAASAAPARADLILVDNGGTGPSSSSGSGTLASLMTAAAAMWESAIPELTLFDVKISYGWGSPGSGILGVHTLVSQSYHSASGSWRETEASLTFSNAFSWFMDSTPTSHSEWSTFTSSSQDLGGSGGAMNVGNVYTSPSSVASGYYDLLTVVLHEMAHALGLSSANTSFQSESTDGDIDVTAGLYAGAAIPLATGYGAHLSMSSALMYWSISKGQRRLISEADIWANQAISGWDMTVVPEPATLALVGLGAGGLLLGRRRRRRSA